MTKRGGKTVGYKRVSTVDQNTVRQLDGVLVDKCFEDKVSGKNTGREGLQACLDYLRDGDELVVHSMDRLSRSLPDLLRVVDELTKRGVNVRFVKESLTFTGDDNAMSRMLMGVMGSIAQFERELMLERTREGIAKAKAAGKYAGNGRRAKLNATTVEAIRARVAARENVSAIAREFGVSRPTLYRALGG